MRKEVGKKKFVWVLGIVIVAVLIGGSFWIVQMQSSLKAEAAIEHSKTFLTKMLSEKITAHRGGGNYAPENTIAGIEYAIKIGAAYAEIDVCETKDGEIVLSHDGDLTRVTKFTARNKISETTLKVLKTANVGKYFNANQKIATLNEVLQTAKGKIKINIEIKDGTSGDKELVNKVVEIIKKNNAEEHVIVTSFNYVTLQLVRSIAPEIKIGIITGSPYDKIKTLDVDAYSMDHKSVTAEIVEQVHGQNRLVFAWTVNNEKRIKELLNMDVDSIITDEPVLLRQALENT